MPHHSIKMSLCTTVFAMVIAVVGLTSSVHSGAPERISFQGILTDNMGDPVADGSYSVVFTIYDAASGVNSKWSETQNVMTSNGLFAIRLGKNNPILDTVFNEPNRYLGVKVGADPELTPRTQLLSVGYSLRIATVDGATGGDLSGDLYVQNDLSADGDLMINGKATIGPANAITGTNAFVAGAFNDATGPYAVISGGSSNQALSSYSTIGGGSFNYADSGGTVGGGYRNLARGIFSVVAGGGSPEDSNVAWGDYSAILGGKGHWADGFANTIGGGQENSTSGDYTTISGGLQNSATGDRSTIGGGWGNTAESGGTISGGAFNNATGSGSFVGAGNGNRARGINSVVVGGGGSFSDSNSALGDYSFVPGGAGNIAAGNYSFAAGYRARANHLGTFVWGDSSGSVFGSTEENQFLIRASGGVGIGTNTPSNALTVAGDADITGNLGIGTNAPSNTLTVGGDADITGNLGIGTPTPGNLLHLYRNGIPGVLLEIEQNSDSTGALMRFTNNGAPHGFNIGQDYINKDFGFTISNPNSPFTRYFTIDTTGRVGINTTSPSAMLHVNGNARIDDDLEIYMNPSTRTVLVQGTPNGSNGGKVTLYTIDGTTRGVELAAGLTTTGGILKLRKNGVPTVQLVGSLDISGSASGGLTLYHSSNGTPTLELIGQQTTVGGGAISIKNSNGVETIKFDGENGSGKGRVTTDILQINGGSDLSEKFEVIYGINQNDLSKEPQPGSIVCIDPANPGKLVVSQKEYDRRVAGIISGAGDVNPGMIMSQAGTIADGDYPVALAGRVYCMVDADQGTIEPGDLLTTSSTPGHAMKVSDFSRANGAIIGKAMTALESGRGLVLVLVSLQ